MYDNIGKQVLKTGLYKMWIDFVGFGFWFWFSSIISPSCIDLIRFGEKRKIDDSIPFAILFIGGKNDFFFFFIRGKSRGVPNNQQATNEK